MKRILMCLVMAAFALGLSGQVFAQEKAKKYTGQVVSVDASQITVKSKSKRSETFSIDEKTVLKRSKKPVQVSEITADDKVTVKYRVEAEKKTAISITVFKKKA
ncbi:MAG: hypothetical protein A2297_06605 [Elusimicrobia bacterium RIFOXYB2_FULL_48_7]|nr:MAG: hypothetical protein A2297_06605 [Elusimicrobia bacterium RIFOXYB2_FULL_48_7]